MDRILIRRYGRTVGIYAGDCGHFMVHGLFANFAEAIAEGRGKAQAESLRASKREVEAHKIPSADQKDKITVVPSALLKKGDIVLVKAGEQIPADGEVIDGAASVDESAITGESAPVIRESGGDRSAVTGGTTVLSDWIAVEVTNEAGESFLDKMIAMVEGAERKKTPNEIALQIFLVALSIIFILVTMSLYTYSMFSAQQAGIENPTSVTTLVALLVCLAPTTIGALLSAIGIAGMSRLNPGQCIGYERPRDRSGRRRRYSFARQNQERLRSATGRRVPLSRWTVRTPKSLLTRRSFPLWRMKHRRDEASLYLQNSNLAFGSGS